MEEITALLRAQLTNIGESCVRASRPDASFVEVVATVETIRAVCAAWMTELKKVDA